VWLDAWWCLQSFHRKLFANLPSPDGSWAQFIKLLEWDGFQRHGKEECFDVIITSG
jgi:hypothetical protein